MSDVTVLALCGGIGGAKLALGLAHTLPGNALAIVANTGDDFEHLGLHISPDIDTILYTLAHLNNPDTGWGRAQEQWECMAMLEMLGGETWFQLGDKDLAMHLYRTARLRAGASVSEVTNELRERLRIGPEVIPMSDDPVRTELETLQGHLPFQEYFVRLRCQPEVLAVQYGGAADARPAARFMELLGDKRLEAIIICPSNPYLSIDPILSIPGVREAIAAAAAPVIAVSAIVGGRAIKGPTAKIMKELGVPVSAATVARHYQGLIDGFVLDAEDVSEAALLKKDGIACHVTNTVMLSFDDRVQLARDVLEFVRCLNQHKREPDTHVGSAAG